MCNEVEDVESGKKGRGERPMETYEATRTRLRPRKSSCVTSC